MLTPGQVIPFLEHPDRKIRDHAAYYLATATDAAPATAEDFWRGIDRFGMKEANALVARLHQMPQTEGSHARLMAALRDGVGGDVEYHLLHALISVDWNLLVRHRDELLAFDKAPAELREHLAERLALEGVPLDDLWERLLQRSKEVSSQYSGKFDHRVHTRLIEALARRFPQPAGERATDLLVNGPCEDWAEIFCVILLGQARYRQAVPVLIERMGIDADVLRERAGDALIQLGDADVVARIEAFYPGKEWHVRLYVNGPLGKIKLPQSEAALVRLIRIETDPVLLAGLGGELCDLCPTPESLQVVRRLVVEQRYDPMTDKLDERLLTAGAMVGYEPPEAPQWRKVIAERDAARAERVAMFDNLLGPVGGTEKFMSTVAEALAAMKEGKTAAAKPAPQPARLPRPAGGPAPIRQEQKVGRNDPCRCGSGKKYKKCCMPRDKTG